jgi:hypothetical protein
MVYLICLYYIIFYFILLCNSIIQVVLTARHPIQINDFSKEQVLQVEQAYS